MKYGRYEIHDELGKGSMGVVYRAHDPDIDRMVALKVLRRDRVSGEDFSRRFLKEARAIGRLSHPNIVTVYDVGSDHETIYIAEEFLDGRPLNEIYGQSLPDLHTIVEIGTKVAQALDYSHRRGIVHRDIKPSNIMLTRDGRIKITDFGIAHVEDAAAPQMTQAGEILGTPNYMSPEQVKSDPVDGRSDLYSLGVILYELATGKRPYSGKNLATTFHAILHQEAASPMALEPFVSRGLPSSLSETILKSIEKMPGKRFQNGADMARALTNCNAPPRPHVQTAAPEKKSSRALITAIFIALGVLLAGGGVFFFRNSFDRQQRQVLQTAPLAVTSDPAGAQLYVDGALKGRTPLRLELPLGSHEVRLFLPDHYEWEAQLQLEEPIEKSLSIPLMPRAEDG